MCSENSKTIFISILTVIILGILLQSFKNLRNLCYCDLHLFDVFNLIKKTTQNQSFKNVIPTYLVPKYRNGHLVILPNCMSSISFDS